MEKEKLALLQSDLIELVKKHCEDPKKVYSFFYDYLPMALPAADKMKPARATIC